MLESALEAGFSAAGIDVHMCGPMPTPAVAYLTRALRLTAGVVISASHNPYPDNGIKFFSGDGFKLPDTTEAAIEGGDGAADGLQPGVEARQGVARGRCARPLHRVLQVDLSVAARPQGTEDRGRLRERRRLPRGAARVPRARRRRGLDRRQARRLQHQRAGGRDSAGFPEKRGSFSRRQPGHRPRRRRRIAC
jgi:hypothetical protein